jgi:hypothetical protein
MLEIENREYFQEVVLAAVSADRWNDKKVNGNTVRGLAYWIGYLAGYADTDEHRSGRGGRRVRALLYKDFAPLSFSFLMQMEKTAGEDDWELWFNGGLIFHGSHDGYGSGSAPTFSVTLNDTDGWSVHT